MIGQSIVAQASTKNVDTVENKWIDTEIFYITIISNWNVIATLTDCSLKLISRST